MQKKKFQKVMALALAASMMAGLTACGGGEAASTDSASSAKTETTTQKADTATDTKADAAATV